MIVDCAHYRDGRRQHEGPMRPEEAAAICGREPGFVWLGMVDPSPDELASMQEVFGLHELAVEDAQSFHLRPKVEQYEEGIAFVVLRTARYLPEREEVEFGEISIFLGASFVITVRQGGASDLHSARLRLEERPQLLREGPRRRCGRSSTGRRRLRAGRRGARARHRGDRAGRLLRRGRAGPADLPAAPRGERLLPRGAPAARAGVRARARRHARRDARGRQYFRDVNDHLDLVNEEIVAQRDLLSTILQANMAVIGVEQSDIVRKISGWAAIITVPTFIASFYGMNFEHMPELAGRAPIRS